LRQHTAKRAVTAWQIPPVESDRVLGHNGSKSCRERRGRFGVPISRPNRSTPSSNVSDEQVS
jgi:hypothetical protein